MSKNWKPATQLVHGGTQRSQFGETSEALYLTQGFVYDSAEAAEARFNGDEEGYVYSRYANPTVSMFEERMCALEGAEAALGTASGMGAISSALMCQVKAGDHVVSARALFIKSRWNLARTWLSIQPPNILMVRGAVLAVLFCRALNGLKKACLTISVILDRASLPSMRGFC